MDYSNYYERYWLKETANKNGFANLPPEWNIKNLDRILRVSTPYLKGKVLDIGCGSGFFTNAVSNVTNVKKCFGIDISKRAINLARAKYPHINFQVASATQLPFKQNYFDAITVIEVVEHILDIDTLFLEFNRVLKRGGIIVITTTDFNLLKKIIISTLFWEKYFYPTNPHIRFFTKRSLKNVLNRSGFEVIKHKWNGSYLGIMPKGQIMIAEKIQNIYKDKR